MLHIGVDVPKKFSRLGVFAPAGGELSEWGEVRSHQELLARVGALPGPKRVVLEAGRNSHCLAAKLETVAVESGEGSRFGSPKQLRGYSGLCARVRETGGRRSYGPLTKRGNRWLRYAAVLAAQRIAQTRDADPHLKRVYLATAFRHGRNPGKVACARRLLDLAYHLLTQEEEYRKPLARSQGRAA